MKPIEKKTIFPPETVRRLPITREDFPVGAASRLLSPMDLSRYGYVEEEYIVSGRALVYTWPKEEERPLALAEGPYCTRILVRKPKDPKRFSGTVAMESFNGSFTIDHANGGWGLTWEHLVASGDGWVGYTKDGNCVEALKAINPQRYAGLGYPNPRPPSQWGEPGWDPFLEYCRRHNAPFPLTLDPRYERGLTYEAMYQIGALIKSGREGDPFQGYGVKRLIAFGINDYNTHVAALHPYLRLGDGAPVVDGYLMYMSGEGGQLNYSEDCFALDDPRCRRTCDVPVIKVETAGDLGGHLPHPLWAALWRCEDGDAPGRQMRWYEIPGLGVAAAFRSDQLFFACREDYAKVGQPAFPRFPYWNQMSRHIVAGAYRNVKDWADRGTPPPRADKIAIRGSYPHIQLNTDGDGNHIGGIRHPYLEAPIARFGEDSSIVFFSKDKRDSLYRDQDDYIAQVEASARRMAAQKWILPEAVQALVEQAQGLAWD